VILKGEAAFLFVDARILAELMRLIAQPADVFTGREQCIAAATGATGRAATSAIAATGAPGNAQSRGTVPGNGRGSVLSSDGETDPPCARRTWLRLLDDEYTGAVGCCCYCCCGGGGGSGNTKRLGHASSSGVVVRTSNLGSGFLAVTARMRTPASTSLSRIMRRRDASAARRSSSASCSTVFAIAYQCLVV
jgi:hypothetical protein